MGKNQLSPIAPRIPDERFAVGLFRGPNSESMAKVIAISVDEPSNRIPPNVELITPCQSCSFSHSKRKIEIKEKVFDNWQNEILPAVVTYNL